MTYSSIGGLIKVSVFLSIVVVTMIISGIVVAVHANVPDGIPENSAESLFYQTGGLDSVATTTSLEADVEAYIRASESLPNANDFNDSYSDLNR